MCNEAKPDWNEAPEGATHWNGNLPLPWLREGSPAYFWDGEEWIEYPLDAVASDQHLHNAKPRPTVVDWSTAPEWANVLLEYKGSWKRVFAEKAESGSDRQHLDRPDEIIDIADINNWHVIATRPADTPTWDGKGYPPVGTVCEYRVNDGPWFECHVRYVIDNDPAPDADGWQAVIWCPHLGKEQIAMLVGSMDFRPIRTPDQIAAEQREKTIREMFEVMTGHDDLEGWSDTCYELLSGLLYDAGFRMSEAGADSK